jgi:hypothetical protein
MPQRLTLRERPDLSDRDWNRLVRSYPDATIFHLSGWHDVLGRSHPGAVIRFQIEQNGEVCGHWCGLLLSRFGARVFGAPMPGSATDYMYPLFATTPPAPETLLDTLSDWARARSVALLEIGGAYFGETALAAKGYAVRHTRSYRVDLSGGEAGVWKQLKPAMRNKVRKAEKHGVIVTRDTPHDFPERFFGMLRQVFLRQGAVPTYSLGLIRTVVDVLGEAGQLQTLTAWHEGQPVSALILFRDGRSLYFWGGASYETAFPVGANDLIHWHALREGANQGLLAYDTCGGGDYKEKFGGTLIHYPAGHLAVNPLFGIVRSVVKRGVSARQRVLGHLQTLRQRSL